LIAVDSDEEAIMAIQPREDQIQALLDNDKGGPINMLNLLKFREFAQYPDGRDSDISGQEAYQRYGVEVAKLIEELGGEFVFLSPADVLLIGDDDLQWDMVGIVKYPSKEAFMAMSQSESYNEIHVHRDAGLEHQLLVQC
jgi:uncharacterized protein (DUF1330 family)